MADRDALIAICWIAIGVLVFIECFYRRVKRRFNRDVQPRHAPLQSPVPLLDQLRLRNREEMRTCGELLPAERYSDAVPNYNQVVAGGALFPNSDALERETCRISVEGEPEEPPPTYEEAMTFARLSAKFHMAPYGDQTISWDVARTEQTNNGDTIAFSISDETKEKEEAKEETEDESDDPNQVLIEHHSSGSSSSTESQAETEDEEDMEMDSPDWNNNNNDEKDAATGAEAKEAGQHLHQLRSMATDATKLPNMWNETDKTGGRKVSV